mmetsp:Transcript_25958/g.77415  ORF Transcript_25958/g.77415 Transcript_25958/m.77415 type:complete len:272 (-) Transcript_25958:109-924(-)
MGQQLELSVVVPAFDEAPNIEPLTRRLFAATRKACVRAELIVADDESPGSAATAAAVAALAAEGFEVQLLARKRGEGRGLASAVLNGFGAAAAPVVLCMDADLQHEPEAVPAVARPVLDGDADFAVGSRNVGGGGVGFEWSLLRRAISHGATLLAVPLSGSSDPMSGFFCLSKETLARGAAAGIKTKGFKIGLELMVRCRCTRVRDVPITFRDRLAGESKLTMRQNIEYVLQLADLYVFKFGLLPLVLPLAAALAALALALALAVRAMGLH